MLGGALRGGLEVGFVRAILKRAKKGEEKGRKTKVQKRRRDSVNQKSRDSTEAKNTTI